MTRRRFIPGIETAPGPHRAMVRNPRSDDQIRFGVRRVHARDLDRAQQDLATKRMLAGRLGGVALQPMESIEPQNSSRAGWNSLREGGHRWLDRHLSRIDIPKYNNMFADEDEARAHVIQAAKDGYSTDVAYLEAVAYALSDHDFDEPNSEIAGWARSSVGFIIEWAGLDDQTDWKLAWALSKPKPQTPNDVFKNLHFNPRWFVADDEMQRVRIDPAQAANLRDVRDRLPQAGQNPRVPLFACPAGNMIPRMHAFAVEKAEEAGLFELTYLERRADLGYAEAWTALDGLRQVTASAGQVAAV